MKVPKSTALALAFLAAAPFAFARDYKGPLTPESYPTEKEQAVARDANFIAGKLRDAATSAQKGNCQTSFNEFMAAARKISTSEIDAINPRDSHDLYRDGKHSIALSIETSKANIADSGCREYYSQKLPFGGGTLLRNEF